MGDFVPKHLKKSDVTQIVNAHLRNVEKALLLDHIHQIQTDHAPSGEISLADAGALMERLEAERDRLLALAEEE
jgi:hypothetical protein